MDLNIFSESILNSVSDENGAPITGKSEKPKPTFDLTFYDFFPFSCLLITKFYFIERIKSPEIDKYLFYRSVYLTVHMSVYEELESIKISYTRKYSEVKLVNPYFIDYHDIKFGINNLGIEIGGNLIVNPIVGEVMDKKPIERTKLSQIEMLQKPVEYILFEGARFLNTTLCDKICPYRRRCMYGIKKHR